MPIPDPALMPLRRDGLDPVPSWRRSAPKPDQPGPIGFGINMWRSAAMTRPGKWLADTKSFSNDFVNLTGNSRRDGPAGPGRPGFRRPAVNTRLRKLLTPSSPCAGSAG